jgi:hypothetical protein
MDCLFNGAVNDQDIEWLHSKIIEESGDCLFSVAMLIQGNCKPLQTAVKLKNAVFWVMVTLCSSRKSRCFGGNIASIIRVKDSVSYYLILRCYQYIDYIS